MKKSSGKCLTDHLRLNSRPGLANPGDGSMGGQTFQLCFLVVSGGGHRRSLLRMSSGISRSHHLGLGERGEIVEAGRWRQGRRGMWGGELLGLLAVPGFMRPALAEEASHRIPAVSGSVAVS